MASKNTTNNQYENIIISLANVIVEQMDGVASIAGRNRSLFKNKPGKNSGIQIYINDQSVTIDISINVYYGFRVPEVAYNLQKKLQEEIEKATKFNVRTVNVNVVGVVFTS